MHEYINCDIALPAKPMKVRWEYNDGSKDIGWWNGKYFMTRDPNRMLPIISWQPIFDYLTSKQ